MVRLVSSAALSPASLPSGRSTQPALSGTVAAAAKRYRYPVIAVPTAPLVVGAAHRSVTWALSASTLRFRGALGSGGVGMLR